MIDTSTVAESLERHAAWIARHDAWSCGMAFAAGPVFEESYAVRATVAAGRLLGIERARSVALSFCDRVLAFQGLVEPDMYYMGYGNNVDAAGVPCCSCVADASSTAMAVAETLQAWPDAPNAGRYRSSLRHFADHVLATYRDPEGVIGVGILSHKPNPWPRYWCANSLFGCVLIALADLTGEERYLDAALPALEYLARYDYRTTIDRQWELSPTEMVFYAAEGMLAAVASRSMSGRLARPPRGFAIEGGTKTVAADAAANRTTLEQPRSVAPGSITLAGLLADRWEELASWLLTNQDPDGSWPTTKPYSCYQAGLSWTMLRATRCLEGQERLEPAVSRQAAFLASPRARPFLGLYCNLFASSLAWLSLAAAGEYCRDRDPDGFGRALAGARRVAIADPW